VLVEQEVEGPAVRLRTYPIWLVHRPPYHLRLATGGSAAELTLWPTAEERARELARLVREADERARSEAERAAAEAERAAAEAERAAAEAERAAQAEAEVERLRAELARLRGG
jgi:hypothetical protein